MTHDGQDGAGAERSRREQRRPAGFIGHYRLIIALRWSISNEKLRQLPAKM